jgi:hypothetical protein
MRFCPGCGFRLDGVADLLARDGVPTNPLNHPQINELSPRKRGIRVGGKMIFFSIAMFLPILIFAIGIIDHPFPLILPGSLFLAGIFWMLYYRLFGDEYVQAVRQPEFINPATSQHTYLPPAQSTPAYHSPVDPPKQQSVVENTTRSLGQQ